MIDTQVFDLPNGVCPGPFGGCISMDSVALMPALFDDDERILREHTSRSNLPWSAGVDTRPTPEIRRGTCRSVRSILVSCRR